MRREDRNANTHRRIDNSTTHRRRTASFIMQVATLAAVTLICAVGAMADDSESKDPNAHPQAVAILAALLGVEPLPAWGGQITTAVYPHTSGATAKTDAMARRAQVTADTAAQAQQEADSAVIEANVAELKAKKAALEATKAATAAHKARFRSPARLLARLPARSPT